MIIEELKKIRLRVYIISLIITSVISLTLLGGYEKKDIIIIFAATYFLIIEIYLIFKNKNSSILLFIISIPILVTARKLCYFNFYIVRVTYETIYITILFINSFNKVKEMIKNYKLKDKNFNNLILLLFIMIIFAYNSCSFSSDVFYSLGEVYIGLITPIMFMLTIIATLKKQDIKSILYSLFIAMDLSCLYGFMQILALRIPANEIILNRMSITFGFHNINIFAAIIINVIPVVLYSIVYKKNSKKEKIFLIGSFILNNVSLLITYSRGAWICVIVSIIIVIFNKKYKKTIILFGALMLLVLKPALTFILSRGNHVTIWENTSIIARVQGTFTDLVTIINLPFGGGPGTYPYLYKKYAVLGYKLIPDTIRYKITTAPYALENAHNLFFQIGVEFGLVCLLVFLLIIINRLAAIFKKYKENKGIFSAIISYSMISMLTGSELNHKGVITGTLILFLYFGIIELNKE